MARTVPERSLRGTHGAIVTIRYVRRKVFAPSVASSDADPKNAEAVNKQNLVFYD